jgi:flagellar hook-associated protein 3 FlgL
MRVTPGMISAQVLGDLQAALAAISEQQAHLSSGRRINAPADDPSGAAQSLTLRARQAATAQFEKNVKEALDALGSADGVLRSVVEVATRAKELAVQGANDTNDAQARQALASEVNQLLESAVSLGNSRGTRGQFIFGGQESTTAPYSVTRDASGRITAVAVNARGIDGQTPAEVSEGLTIGTTVSGTTLFGAPTDATYTFSVLMRLRDRLNANNALQNLTFAADVGASGAASGNAYQGIVAATDLQVAGPSGTAYVRLTAAADDSASAVGRGTSAIAAAAAINASNGSTGVSATASQAQVTFTGGTFASNITLDGTTAGNTLVVNGTSVTGAVSGGSPTARRDALVALINAQVSGVVAGASGASGLTLTAADGRNISVATDATVTASSANSNFFGFTSGLVAEQVVARGGVTLTSTTAFTTTASQTPANQIAGTGATTASVQAGLEELDAVLDRATGAWTTVGTRMSWLGLIDARLADDSLAQATSLSRIEDLDLAKAVSDLTQIQTFYEAALASGARLLQQSLVNFLR